MKTTIGSSHNGKKELTATQQKVKTILNWVVNILCVVLIIFALIVAIFTIIRTTNKDKITRVGDNCYFSVASDSMEPTFNKNDVIIAKAYEGDGSDLKIGQVVTFKFTYIASSGVGYEAYNTHRIMRISKDSSGRVISVRTRGDNQSGTWQEGIELEGQWDGYSTAVGDIVATWGEIDSEGNFTTGKVLKGAGALGNFMQDPEDGQTRFFCIVVLPLILLFVIYAFILVRTLIIAKLENAKKVAGEQAITVDSLSDEEKRRLAQEYLASLSAQSAQENKSEDNTVTEGADKAEATETEVTESETAEPNSADTESTDTESVGAANNDVNGSTDSASDAE